jgi:cytochrome c oxidase subunit 3
MPGTSTTPDIELIIEKKNGRGGGGGDQPPGGGGGGDNDRKRPPKGQPSANRYYTGLAIGIVAILMFFMALASAFLVRKGGPDWIPVHVPAILWFNTAVLVTSSGTLELARKHLAHADTNGFRKFWMLTTALGVLFLIGQVAAWRVLAGQGIYIASNPASSFFYVFTGAHGLHVIGGVAALIYVSSRSFDPAKITRTVAADVAAYYWHFMDALWLFLLALLALGK